MFLDRIKPINSLGSQRLSNYATITALGWGYKNDGKICY